MFFVLACIDTVEIILRVWGDIGARNTNNLKNWLWVCFRPLKIIRLLIILFGLRIFAIKISNLLKDWTRVGATRCETPT